MRARLKAWLKAPAFTPAGFLVRAAVLSGVYGLLSILGLREYTCVLSLTFPGGTPRGLSLFFCLVYLLSYFSFILMVPILGIAAGLLAMALRWVKRV